MKNILKVPLFWILFGWNIVLVWKILQAIFFILIWLIGYFKCTKCKEWFWANKKVIHIQPHRSGSIEYTCCPECKILYQEADDRWNRILPPPPKEWKKHA